jgi:hypothetical protein
VNFSISKTANAAVSDMTAAFFDQRLQVECDDYYPSAAAGAIPD